MRAIVRGRTVIIIAHRLAAVRACTASSACTQGEIVEVGTHEQLLARRADSTPALGAAIGAGEGDA